MGPGEVIAGTILLLAVVLLLIYFKPLMREYVHAHSRAMDLRILWPLCVRDAPSLERARVAFYVHVVNDPAWADHYTLKELHEYITRLEPPLEREEGKAA